MTLSGETLLDEHDERGAPGLQFLAELLHEVVVDAAVGHRAAGRAGRGADRHAEQRHEEDEADQAAPERPAGGAEAAPSRAGGA